MFDPEMSTRPERTNRGVYPAADRVAEAIVAVIDSATDPRSAEAWGRIAIASAGSLRDWCRAAGVYCHDALCFARVLRACHLAMAARSRDGGPVSPGVFLDIIDDHYRARYLQRAAHKPRVSSVRRTFCSDRSFSTTRR